MAKKYVTVTKWKRTLKKLKAGLVENSKENSEKKNWMNEVRDLISEWGKIVKKLKKMSKESQIQLAVNSIFKVFNSTLDRLYKLENFIRQYGEKDRRFYFAPPESKIMKKLKKEVAALLHQSEDETEVLFQKNWRLFADALAWSISSVYVDLTSRYERLFEFSFIGDGTFAVRMTDFEIFVEKLNDILKDIKNIMSEKNTEFTSKMVDIAYKLENINDDFDYDESIFEEVLQTLEQTCILIYDNIKRIICERINGE